MGSALINTEGTSNVTEFLRNYSVEREKECGRLIAKMVIHLCNVSLLLCTSRGLFPDP